MRHEKILQAEISAAAWPAGMEGLVLAEAPQVAAESPAVEEAPMLPTPAAPEFASAVGQLLVGAYVALLLVFFTFFARSPTAFFAITICAGFVAIYFTIPRIFFAVEPDQTRRPTFATFMDRGVDTHTGHSSGRDALVQMLIVPVLLAFGLLAMGIAGRIFLG